MAEREGFEPPVRLRVLRISSATRSTTLPPLRMLESLWSSPLNSQDSAPCQAPNLLDHGHFRSNRPKVTNVIVDSLLARDRTVNRCPLNLITRQRLTGRSDLLETAHTWKQRPTMNIAVSAMRSDLIAPAISDQACPSATFKKPTKKTV